MAEAFGQLFEIVLTPMKDGPAGPAKGGFESEDVGYFEGSEEAHPGSPALDSVGICKGALAKVEVLAEA